MNWCHNEFKSEYFRIPKATKWKVAPKKAKKQKQKKKQYYLLICLSHFLVSSFLLLNELRYYLFHRASSYVNNFIQFLPSFLSSFSFFFVFFFFFQTVSRINVIFQLWRKKNFFISDTWKTNAFIVWVSSSLLKVSNDLQAFHTQRNFGRHT